MDHLREGYFTSDCLYIGRVFNIPSQQTSYKIVEIGETESYIQFSDKSNYIGKYPNKVIISKNATNPYRLNSYGGYLGEGDEPYDEKLISIWRLMLHRSINKNKPYTTNETYKNVLLDERWLSYQVFAKWYRTQLEGLNPNFKYHIDKDFLQIGLHPKVYGETYCVLIPKELNLTLSNIYNNIDGLPIGVRKFTDKKHNTYYKALSSTTSQRYINYIFNNEQQAFEAYREDKLRHIETLLDYFYDNDGITKENYIRLSYVDILPYNN